MPMRPISILLVLMIGPRLCGQAFTEVPSGTLDLRFLLNSIDSSTVGSSWGRQFSRSTASCTVKVDSFAISSPITVSQFQGFLNYYISMSDTNSFKFKVIDIPTSGQREILSGVAWGQAMAYCQWLTDQQEQKDWHYRLPKLSEWLWAVQKKIVTGGGVGCWLMNAKDESVWDCKDFESFYSSIEGDPSALRRKIVAFIDPETQRTYGIYRNYWEFMSYPNVGFRVVKVKGAPPRKKWQQGNED